MGLIAIVQTFNLYLVSRLNYQIEAVNRELREHQLDRVVHN
jgi:hypothetical protein